MSVIGAAARVAANGLWYGSCLPGALAYRRALRDVAGTQERLLLRTLRRNASGEFGRRHGFATIRTVAEYQARVPLSTYEDYREAVARIGDGERGVLTRDSVTLVEPTSGSTAPTKLIPYTAALQAEFGRAIAPWIADLYRRHPGLLRGQAYWSVTPVSRRDERTPGGLPVGFEDDAEYLGRARRGLLRALLAVPPLVRLIDDMDAFRYVTLLFLLRSRALALISVWNPTFLALLVGQLPAWWSALADDIARGTLSPPAPLAPDLRALLAPLLRPDPRRAAEVHRAFKSGDDAPAIHARLWPHLRLVSCWADGHAALHAPELARLFPQARLQGKGLIATEAFVSFPLEGRPGAALALRSHFFEILPVEDAGDGWVAVESERPLLAHQLEQGGRYAVVVTTGGGLYRYQLRDVVEVVGHHGPRGRAGCPLLRFLGRADAVSDHFGEKLHEGHVGRALAAALARHGVRPSFAMIACDEDEAGGATVGRPAYTLFVEAGCAPDVALRAIGAEVEATLAENYHYRYCRDLGQLGALRVFRIEPGEDGRAGALEAYLAACQRRGQRAGDIKPVALHPLGGWSRVFQGRLLPPGPAAG